MSGGHFSFSYIHIQGELDEVAHDPEVMRRWPFLAQALINLGQRLSGVLHDVDYDLSGDTDITDDGAFQVVALHHLARAIEEVDRIMKRGGSHA